MKKLLLFAMCMIVSASCSQNSIKSFDDYPVPQGKICEMSYNPSATTFTLWSPAADAVQLNLYSEDLGGEPTSTISMKKGKQGTWSAKCRGDLKGTFYTFNVLQEGEWHGETPGIFAVATGRNGQRAAVVEMGESNPEGWSNDQVPHTEFNDIIIYEMHHRDFSISNTSGISNRGKFLALTEQGTKVSASSKSDHSAATGIDHLKELGVTHIHILPSFDFGSIDETCLEKNTYNWGYDPVNYNVPEGSYSTDPSNPLCRIREFKQMVLSFHRAGLRAVLDVVYNHTFNTEGSPFERTSPGYFYRADADGNLCDGSGCGNETASERPMMRKYMIESIAYWAREYHIDGFRVDLMGIHDIETMNAIRAALDEIDPTIFIYGEGWAASTPALDADKLAMKENTWQMPRIAAFSDELRDCLRGPWSSDSEGTFLIGNAGYEEGIRFGLSGAIENIESNHPSPLYNNTPWAAEPTQMIAYVSCHDDMCLADRLKATLPSATNDEMKRLVKLAETIVLCSQGVPFIFAGDEVMRSKQGVHNSYNSPDSINAIDWNLKLQNFEVFDYIRQIIQIRKNRSELRLGSAEKVRERMHFIDTDADNLVAFTVVDDNNFPTLAVAFNSGRTHATVSVPEGEWNVLCHNSEANASSMGTIEGGNIQVPPQSALILAR